MVAQAQKLKKQVQQTVVQLENDAERLVAAEAKRLDEQMQKKMAAMEARAKKVLNNHRKLIVKSVGTESENLRKQIDAALVTLDKGVAQQAKDLQAKVAATLEAVPSQVASQVSKEVSRQLAESSQSDPEPTKPQQDTPEAVNNPATELRSDDKDEDSQENEKK